MDLGPGREIPIFFGCAPNHVHGVGTQRVAAQAAILYYYLFTPKTHDFLFIGIWMHLAFRSGSRTSSTVDGCNSQYQAAIHACSMCHRHAAARAMPHLHRIPYEPSIARVSTGHVPVRHVPRTYAMYTRHCTHAMYTRGGGAGPLDRRPLPLRVHHTRPCGQQPPSYHPREAGWRVSVGASSRPREAGRGGCCPWGLSALLRGLPGRTASLLGG